MYSAKFRGQLPQWGILVTASCEHRRINLQPEYKTVNSIIAHIRDWSADSSLQPPPVVLNKHCPYCPFKIACTGLAEAADNLSLLDRVTTKAMQRYHSKGVFTVTQLSFLFKPRRRKRRDRQRSLTSVSKYKRSPLGPARSISKRCRRSSKAILPSFWTSKGFQIGSSLT